MSERYASSLVAKVAAERLAILQAEKAKAQAATAKPVQPSHLVFAPYYDDPVGFATNVLQLHVWSRQLEILRAVADGDRVAVRSGHKVGKTTTAVIVVLWFLATRPRAKVVVTSSTGQNVREVFWTELKRVHWRARRMIGGVCNRLPSTGLRFDDGRVCIGVAVDKPEAIAGHSGPEMLFVVDEASGVAGEIFEAIEGNRAGNAKMLMTGNPTQQVGVFFDAFHTRRSFYTTIRISSEESPNVTGKEPPVPGLATKAFIEEKRREWGVDSAAYRVRILGDFSGQASNAVIGLDMVEEAGRRWVRRDGEKHETTELHLGVDVARFGDDDSVIAARRGSAAWVEDVVHGMDGVEVADRVLASAKKIRRGGESVIVKIDTTGGYGAAPYDVLKARIKDPHQGLSWLRIIEVNASTKADDEDEFADKRAQLWFGAAQFLLDGGAIAPDPKLEAELLAATYSFDARGRRRVDPKDNMKKRLDGRSPDRADALALAIYTGIKARRRFFGAFAPGRNAA